MKNVKLLLTLIMCSMFQSCSSDEVNLNPQEGESLGQVLFQDEFETFDSNVWTKEEHEAGWVNQELQIYDAAHVSTGIDEGRSVLILTAERKGDKIYSGRVNTQGKKSFKYGKIEASIKLPKTANGLWPAFWMMGDNDMPWPQCGEIDIMEMGEAHGIASGSSETYLNTAIHFGTDYQFGHRQEYHADNVAFNLQDGKYHVYMLEWTENSLIISVDGVKFHTFDISKISGRYEYFHHNFYILFNLAVGGNFPNITDIDAITALKDGEKVNMYIDWIKVY